MESQKRVLAIHDISAFGRCSLTVALPIISAAGIETTVLPTAVLSTHTGGFSGFTYRDLSDDIMPIYEHWKTLNLTFDALYSGFLGSIEQIDMMERIFAHAKSHGSLLIVDPVMADNGVLYAIFPKEFPRQMARLAAKADVLVPNITEACLLLGGEYRKPPYTKDYIESLLRKLKEFGAKSVVLTGVAFNESELGAATITEDGKISYCFLPLIEGYYHGTGDVFGSALTGALMNGKTLAEAASAAVEFTHESIMRTKQAGTDIRYGVNFEQSLPGLLKRLGI